MHIEMPPQTGRHFFSKVVNALTSFQLNMELSPNSVNTYDSYSDIFRKPYRKEEAIKA